MEKIKVKWLDKTPSGRYGATWGIPWKKGVLKKGMLLSAQEVDGNQIPLQTWPTAYWPDGTIKWTAHASTFLEKAPDDFYISVDSNSHNVSFASQILVSKSEQFIEIDTGVMKCTFNKSGENLVKEIKMGDRVISSNGHLVCLMEEYSEVDGLSKTIITPYESNISEVIVEQAGPIRCVVRVRGAHLSVINNRDWIRKKLLPFDIRFYFYAGQESIKIVHTFLYNGNPHTDFIKGIGMVFSVTQSGELYNRHVRFAGEQGLFSEMPKTLATIRTNGRYQDMYHQQVNGEIITFNSEEDSKLLGLLDESPVWDRFKMVQLVPDYYTILKNVKKGCSYIKALSGKRAKGFAFAGGEYGGLAASMRNFWKKCPSAIEINGMTKPEAEMVLWFWSPDAQAMDLRHYDTETHVYSSYEGFQEMRSTPYGIANTSEVTLWCFDTMPNNHHLINLAKEGSQPCQPVCLPSTYKDAGIFGEWALIDRSTPQKSYIEDQLDAVIDFYKQEIESRKWYGFWDYGDVMHSYDVARHSWRYDVGGCAWQNTELMPNMWLWYSFLRSGRADIFRMAEAMTRHNAEVDVYHLGEYAGLGSRHNVIHWGCGCKEARISMAALNRYFYYLTADERMGDLLDEVKDADVAVSRLDPLRAVMEPDLRFDVHVRMGPDVMAFCSNWFTRWERYEDIEYRNKLFKCLNFIKETPYRFIAAKVFGYNPLNTEFIEIDECQKDGHFHFCFGAQFIWLEIARALEDEVLDTMCMDLGQFFSPYAKNKEEILAYWKTSGTNLNMSMYNTGLAAYAANRRNNPGLAHEVWQVLVVDPRRTPVSLPIQPEKVCEEEYPIEINEIKNISTNSVAQWAINTIMSLGLIGDEISKDITKL